MVTIREFADGTRHFRGCINFEQSYLDSDAIQFMNEMPSKIMKTIQQRDDLLKVCVDLQNLLNQDSLLPMLDLKEVNLLRKAETIITNTKTE